MLALAIFIDTICYVRDIGGGNTHTHTTHTHTTHTHTHTHTHTSQGQKRGASRYWMTTGRTGYYYKYMS